MLCLFLADSQQESQDAEVNAVFDINDPNAGYQVQIYKATRFLTDSPVTFFFESWGMC